jgi:pimeloyl-ACP methyl ester carboxylesterase
LQSFKTGHTESQDEIFYTVRGAAEKPTLFWAHGWGQDHHAFEQMIASLEQAGRHVAIDFPGFGRSPPPASAWGTENYADAMAARIKESGAGKVIWIGHSFGCRVGLQLAARHPDLVAGLFLIAAAGLKRKRPLPQKIYFKTRVAVFKLLKKMIPLGVSEEWLKAKFGSADYKNAGPMRAVMVKVINEDLSAIARTIACPVTLVYGENDTETPPEIGRRLATLIPTAELVTLQGQDHYSVLGSGRHMVTALLKKFIDKVRTHA